MNASRRLYGGRTSPSDWTEKTWLNEGLSQIAEELMGYAVSDLAPRQNIDIGRIADSQSATQATTFCVDGGTEGGEFTLVTFHAVRGWVPAIAAARPVALPARRSTAA